jgi:hypothetical protein
VVTDLLSLFVLFLWLVKACVCSWVAGSVPAVLIVCVVLACVHWQALFPVCPSCFPAFLQLSSTFYHASLRSITVAHISSVLRFLQCPETSGCHKVDANMQPWSHTRGDSWLMGVAEDISCAQARVGPNVCERSLSAAQNQCLLHSCKER